MNRLIPYTVLLLSLASIPAGGEELWIELGPHNVAHGLVVGSYGDGQNKPAVLGGKPCRQVLRDQGSSMFYVDVDDRFDVPSEVYVTVEYFDQTGTLTLQFDAVGDASAYQEVPETRRQTDTRTWRTATFTLRRPWFRGRQNGKADFRLVSSGLFAARRIILATSPPKGYVPPLNPLTFFAEHGPVSTPPDMTIIQQWQIHHPVSKARLADRVYKVCRDIGITSLQSYVVWSRLEPEPGQVTFETYDPVVRQLRKYGLKWLPFLITGPYYATPAWFRADNGVGAVCLQHGTSVPIQSIWNPALPGAVRHFLGLFRQHYEADVIEALNLGISGNWGESLMPGGGGFEIRKLPGYHCHPGWWCGDPHAQADLRRWLRQNYGSITALNVAWQTRYPSFVSIRTFRPDKAPSRRAAVDLVRWYQESMTRLAEFWVKTAREFYPRLPIYLCTGGDGNPMLGANFAAQAKMCAAYRAGIRITNEGDDAQRNFAITRMVSSATRLYGGYYTTEPGGANSPDGIAGRVFDIVSGGGCGLYFKTLVSGDDRPSMQATVLARNMNYLVRNTPVLTVAALMPTSSMALQPRVLTSFLDHAADLRDILDFEFVDETMIADGMLSRFRALILPAGHTLETASLVKIKAWVEAGGVLFLSADSYPLRTVEDAPATWLPRPQRDRPLPLVVNIVSHPVPKGIHVDMGGNDDQAIAGSWHAPEGRSRQPTAAQPDPTYRWTTEHSRLILPLPRGKPLRLRVKAAVNEHMRGTARVTVNGIPVLTLETGKPAWRESLLPAAAIRGKSSVRVAFENPVWMPAPPGSGGDSRRLGVQVFAVELAADGAAASDIVALDTLRVEQHVDLAVAVPLAVRARGRGYIAIWPGTWDSYRHFLNAALHAQPPAVPWPDLLAEPLDTRFDHVLACRADQHVLYYNNGDRIVQKRLSDGQALRIPPRTIVRVTRPENSHRK